MLSVNLNSIQQELQRQRQLLANYEELLLDNEEDSAYVARGNGFCDAKYSEDFLNGQIAQIKAKIARLEQMLK